MRTNFSHMMCAAFMLLWGVGPLSAQEELDKTYSLILSGGGGVTKNISVFAETPGGLNQMGFSGTVRLMWKPEYLVSVGLETGYTHIYSIQTPPIVTSSGTSEFSALLSAVPIQFLLSMPLWEDFELYGGAGIFIVSSHLEGFGTSMDKSVVSMGNTFALSYSRPVAEDMRLGTEVKWQYMDKFQDNNISVHFMLYYTLAKY